MSNAERRQVGFTLIELLVVVLIIGLVSSIVIPLTNRAIEKSHRAATGATLLELYDAMTRYAADNGDFPALDTTTFEPLVSGAYLENAESMRSKFNADQVQSYFNLGSFGWWLVVRPKGDPESFMYTGRILLSLSEDTLNWDGVYWYRYGETNGLSGLLAIRIDCSRGCTNRRSASRWSPHGCRPRSNCCRSLPPSAGSGLETGGGYRGDRRTVPPLIRA